MIVLAIVCFGCKKNNNLDLEDLYEKNYELASGYFYGWGADDYKYELIIVEPETASETEKELFSYYFIDGLEKLLYIKYEREEFIPYVVAFQYKSIEQSKEAYILNSPKLMRNKNIVATQTTGAYMLLYGEYKEVDGYYLSLDGETLLFDNNVRQRIDVIIPEGVKYIPSLSLFSDRVRTIKCNSELEILHDGAFAMFPTLEKIELNDGLKEIGMRCFEFHKLQYIVIPKSVEKINSEAFQNVTIYCEVSERPAGWHDDFALNNCTVYWGGTWEYVDGVPQPIVNEIE